MYNNIINLILGGIAVANAVLVVTNSKIRYEAIHNFMSNKFKNKYLIRWILNLNAGITAIDNMNYNMLIVDRDIPRNSTYDKPNHTTTGAGITLMDYCTKHSPNTGIVLLNGEDITTEDLNKILSMMKLLCILKTDGWYIKDACFDDM